MQEYPEITKEQRRWLHNKLNPNWDYRKWYYQHWKKWTHDIDYSIEILQLLKEYKKEMQKEAEIKKKLLEQLLGETNEI